MVTVNDEQQQPSGTSAVTVAVTSPADVVPDYVDDDDDDDVTTLFGLGSLILMARTACSTRLRQIDARFVKTVIGLIVLGLYLAYYTAAMIYSVEGAMTLTVLNGIVILVYVVLRWKNSSMSKNPAITKSYAALLRLIKWSTLTASPVLIVCYMSLVAVNTGRQLRAVGGAVFMLVTSFTTSRKRHKVPWSVVIYLLSINFLITALISRTSFGMELFTELARDILKFASNYVPAAIAVFEVSGFLTHLIFVSSVVSLMFLCMMTGFFYAIFVWIGISWRMEYTVRNVKNSQMHFFLVTAHAISSGIILCWTGVWGIHNQHLMTASFATIPAASAVALINYPTKLDKAPKKPKTEQMLPPVYNLYRCVLAGAKYGFVASMTQMAVSIAYESIYHFFDVTVAWLGSRVGLDVTIKSILGYVMMPFVYLVGVNWSDSYLVGCLFADRAVGQQLKSLRDLGNQRRANKLAPDTAALSTILMCGLSTGATFLLVMSFFYALVGKIYRRRLMKIFPRIMFNVHLASLYTASVVAAVAPDSYYDSGWTLRDTLKDLVMELQPV